MFYKTTLPFILLAAAGCSSGSVPELEGFSASTHSAVTVATAVPGYIHDLSRSRFRIGQATAVEQRTPTLVRWRGTRGAFGLDPTNGLTMAILDATSSEGPYILDEDVSAQNVRDYFVGAGLPADQIGAVTAAFLVSGGGGPNDLAVSAPVKFDSINSRVERQIRGIHVVDSYAWAKMTTAGEVDMESVFWPPIDATVVDRAVKFSAAMADSSKAASYRAGLPGPILKDGGVVIHHSESWIHSAPTAYVSYDMTLDGSSSAGHRHFDENGIEFRLPQELMAEPPSSRP